MEFYANCIGPNIWQKSLDELYERIRIEQYNKNVEMDNLGHGNDGLGWFLSLTTYQPSWGI